MTSNRVFDILYSESGVVSGEQIAERLGITRTAVNKHIRKLQEIGIVIESSKRGYKYIPSDTLTVSTLSHRLIDKGIDIDVYVESVDSTNNAVKQLISSSHQDRDFVWAAPMQTAGRGRLDRRFLSGEGGVYMTLCYRPCKLAVTDSLKVVLLTGLCIAKVLSEYTDGVEIKWPNDVFIKGKKAVGILLESVVSEYTVDRLILGIGINVNNKIPDDIRDIAVSLSECGVNEDREILIAKVLSQLYIALNIYQREGFDSFKDEYTLLSRTLGKNVTVNGINGKMSGYAVGLSSEGYLLLDIDGKIEKVIVGDVEGENVR